MEMSTITNRAPWEKYLRAKTGARAARLRQRRAIGQVADVLTGETQLVFLSPTVHATGNRIKSACLADASLRARLTVSRYGDLPQ